MGEEGSLRRQCRAGGGNGREAAPKRVVVALLQVFIPSTYAFHVALAVFKWHVHMLSAVAMPAYSCRVRQAWRASVRGVQRCWRPAMHRGEVVRQEVLWRAGVR